MRLLFKRGRADDLKTLHPAYFALVMAPGIVAIAAHMHGVPEALTFLFWLNADLLSLHIPVDVARGSDAALLEHAPLSPFVVDHAPFIKGLLNAP